MGKESCSEKMMFFGCLLSLGGIVAASNFFIIPVLIQMLFYTFPTIYLGSHLSLRQSEIDPVTGETPNRSESMNKYDAMMFPFIGSGALLLLYVAYKYLDPWYVNMLLTAYLSFLGMIAFAETVHTLVLPSVPAPMTKNVIDFKIHSAPFGSAAKPLEVQASATRIILYALSICTTIAWIITKSWVIHNLFAIAFCMQAIALISVGDFQIATILLCGLFVYDIFWVFGTEVMVTVAMSFEGPAKLIFPVSHDPWKQSILGLGDIVIPGIFIAMCLRFDLHMSAKRLLAARKKDDDVKQNIVAKGIDEVDIHQKFGKFYFWVDLVSYELGLITTGVVMLIFESPQPALLYLVPYCLLSVMGMATLNGEVKEMFAYKDEAEAHEERPTPAVATTS